VGFPLCSLIATNVASHVDGSSAPPAIGRHSLTAHIIAREPIGCTSAPQGCGDTPVPIGFTRSTTAMRRPPPTTFVAPPKLERPDPCRWRRQPHLHQEEPPPSDHKLACRPQDEHQIEDSSPMPPNSSPSSWCRPRASRADNCCEEDVSHTATIPMSLTVAARSGGTMIKKDRNLPAGRLGFGFGLCVALARATPASPPQKLLATVQKNGQ
jgi:hypothetical protein